MEAPRRVLVCPKCGGPLPAAAAHEVVTCAFCGFASEPEPTPQRVIVFKNVQVAPPAASPAAASSPAKASKEGHATTLPCPRCPQLLYEIRVGSVELAGCGECGGIWVDSESIPLAMKRVDKRIEELAGRAAEHATFRADTSRTAACPVCHFSLQRVPLSRAGIVVDFCANHGTWFDRAELGRVLEVVHQRQQAKLDSLSPYAQPVASGGIVALVSHLIAPG